jgi:hypothetical protein
MNNPEEDVQKITNDFLKAMDDSVERRTAGISIMIKKIESNAPEKDFYKMLISLFSYPEVIKSKEASGYFSDSTIFEFGLFILPYSFIGARIKSKTIGKTLSEDLTLHLYQKFVDIFAHSNSPVTPSKELISHRDSFYRAFNSDGLAYPHERLLKVLNHTYGSRVLPIEIDSLIQRKPPAPFMEKFWFKRNLYTLLDTIPRLAQEIYFDPKLLNEAGVMPGAVR